MEPKFQSSFIPKKPIGSTGTTSSVSVIRSTNIFSVMATVVFLVTLATSVGLFIYKNVLTDQIAQADKDITANRAAFQPEKIQQLVDANSRITASGTLLEKHVVVSKLLGLLQQLTLKKMHVSQFDYSNKNGASLLNLVGEVQTYNALAEQQDVFSKSEFIKNPVFSNFNLGDNGYITIAFSATIDPTLISYKRAIQASQTQSQ